MWDWSRWGNHPISQFPPLSLWPEGSGLQGLCVKVRAKLLRQSDLKNADIYSLSNKSFREGSKVTGLLCSTEAGLLRDLGPVHLVASSSLREPSSSVCVCSSWDGGERGGADSEVCCYLHLHPSGVHLVT